MRASLLLLCTLPFAACSSSTAGHGGPGTTIDGLVSIDVEPANQTLIIDGTTAAMQGYTAKGTFSDGHVADLTAQVIFAVADAGLGAFAGPGFTSAVDHGGSTQVTAVAGQVEGVTALTLQMKQRYSDPGSTGLPPNPSGLFGGADTPSLAAQLVYPNDGVLVPPNLGKLEIHWKPAAGTSLYAVRFANATTDVEVYAGCTNPTGGGCIYLPDPQVWHWIAESNRGSVPLAVTVRATDGNGGGVGTSNSAAVSFSLDDINGGLYYWTTSGATAIMRFDFASTTQTTGSKFADPSLGDGKTCIGCHALSRDGTRMVAESGGQNDGRLLLLDVATAMPLVAFGSTPKSIFESWEPSSARYVGVYADAGSTDFNLMLFNGSNGAFLGDIPGSGTAANPADHPDWSLDGGSIAYVKEGIAGTNQRMWSGAIELISSTDGMIWSAPTELVPSVTGKNHYYPSISPDEKFLVYDESTCPAGANTDASCNADTDATATLWAVGTAAGATPINLAKCNAGGLTDGNTTKLTNSFPRWSPFVFKRNAEVSGRLMWMTFSSTRNFGLRPAPASPNPGGESPIGQLIWMAAIDPDKIANGEDGCFAAFALPFQDITTSNHIAQWTTKVVGPIGRPAR